MFIATLNSARFTFAKALGQDEIQGPSIGLGRFSTWGNLSNCEWREQTECLRNASTMFQGLATILYFLAKYAQFQALFSLNLRRNIGKCFLGTIFNAHFWVHFLTKFVMFTILPLKILYYDQLNMHNFRLIFGLTLRIWNFWGAQGYSRPPSIEALDVNKPLGVGSRAGPLNGPGGISGKAPGGGPGLKHPEAVGFYWIFNAKSLTILFNIIKMLGPIIYQIKVLYNIVNLN